VATFDRLRRGEVLVLANCGVLCEGWDMPEVEVGILARPTKSRGLYIQQAGRVLRSAPGKTHAVLLDHAGNVYVHGLPQDYAPVGLEPAREQKPQPTKGCPECETRVSLSTRICPHCDYFWSEAIGERPPIEVEVVSGELVEIGGDPPPKGPTANQMRYFESQCREAHSRGYKPGWAMHRFKARFGFWPDTPPFNEVRMRFWGSVSSA
jgi:DNA repair protein RadD